MKQRSIRLEGHREDTSSGTGDGLGAALDLSDGTSSLVVLHADNDAWANFLPSVLAGQQRVIILRRKDAEDLQQLVLRVLERLTASNPPVQRIIWVMPRVMTDESVDDVRHLLESLCDEQREALLVTGEDVMLLQPGSNSNTPPSFGHPVKPPIRSEVHWDAPDSQRESA